MAPISSWTAEMLFTEFQQIRTHLHEKRLCPQICWFPVLAAIIGGTSCLVSGSYIVLSVILMMKDRVAIRYSAVVPMCDFVRCIASSQQGAVEAFWLRPGVAYHVCFGFENMLVRCPAYHNRTKSIVPGPRCSLYRSIFQSS